jgi:predicted nucleic acid-binding protein
MRLPICTIDSSVVVALDHLDLLPALSLLYSRVLLPKAVRAELFRLSGREERLRTISALYGFIEECDEYEPAAVDVLFSERKASGVKDRGEAETVAQASQLGADVLIDDMWGRKLARRSGRECHGTFWILCRLHALGLASSSETRTYFTALLQKKIRLPWKDVNEFLAGIGEPPIDDGL